MQYFTRVELLFLNIDFENTWPLIFKIPYLRIRSLNTTVWPNCKCPTLVTYYLETVIGSLLNFGQIKRVGNYDYKILKLYLDRLHKKK